MNKILNRKISAGKPGTKKITEQYGDDLVCVRYKYDREKRIKYKTVELIIDRGLWNPDLAKKNSKKVEVIIYFNEIELSKKIKAAGGNWNPKEKVWEINFKTAKELGVTDRIIKDS